MIDLPPDMAVIVLILLVVIMVSFFLSDSIESKLTKRIEHLEKDNVMLARHVQEQRAELLEWIGIPRTLLEHDLPEEEVITE